MMNLNLNLHRYGDQPLPVHLTEIQDQLIYRHVERGVITCQTL